MINSIHIENFRGFESLDVGGFSKFNLIVGTNGVGKTSFLEAVLVGRSTDLRHLSALDGMRGWQRQRARLDTRSVWRYLFLNSELPFVIETIGKVNSVRVSGQFESAETHFLTAGPIVAQPVYATVTEADLSNTPTEDFRWEMTVNGESQAVALAQGTALGPIVHNVKKPDRKFPNKVAFVGQNTAIMPELFDAFSALKAAGAIAPFLAGLRVLVPWIDDVEITTDGGMTLAATGQDHYLVPLPMLGEGAMRLAQILLNVAYVDRGLLMIDEIERGFHHSVLPDIWRALRAAIGETDVQVFATTHSYECIAAADAAFADAPADLALFRLQNVNGKLRAISYPPEARSNAIEFGSEVR